MVTAEQIYAQFKHYPGSEHIASENAIRGLIGVLKRARPRRILEMGSGIGTLSFTIISTMRELRPGDYQLVMVEHHPFCRAQLAINLGDEFYRTTLVRSGREIPSGEFDLIIVDGGDTFDDRYLRFLAPHGMLFVEGHREPQRRIVEQSGRPFVRALYRSMQMEHAEHAAVLHRRNAGGRTVRWSGGYWIYQMNPTWTERARFAAAHLWDGLLVTKRRQIKLARLALVETVRPRRSTEPPVPGHP